IDIETHDRHAEKRREDLTLARIDRHSGQLEELDVEGILAFAENEFCRARPTCGSRPRSISANGSNNCSFPTESRSTEIALLDPAQPHRPSATCGKSKPKMKIWWPTFSPVGTGSWRGCTKPSAYVLLRDHLNVRAFVVSVGRLRRRTSFN